MNTTLAGGKQDVGRRCLDAESGSVVELGVYDFYEWGISLDGLLYFRTEGNDIYGVNGDGSTFFMYNSGPAQEWRIDNYSSLYYRLADNSFFRLSFRLGRREEPFYLGNFDCKTWDLGDNGTLYLQMKGDEFFVIWEDKITSLGVHSCDEWKVGRDRRLYLRRGNHFFSFGVDEKSLGRHRWETWGVDSGGTLIVRRNNDFFACTRRTRRRPDIAQNRPPRLVGTRSCFSWMPGGWGIYMKEGTRFFILVVRLF